MSLHPPLYRTPTSVAETLTQHTASIASHTASIASIVQGDPVLAVATASGDTTMDFEMTGGYEEYHIHVYDAIPSTDSVVARLRTSSDGGVTFDSGATDYTWDKNGSLDADDTGIAISGSVGSGANEGLSTLIKIFRPSETNYTLITAAGHFVNISGYITQSTTDGKRKQNAAVTHIQLLFSSGNVATGLFVLKGIRTTLL